MLGTHTPVGFGEGIVVGTAVTGRDDGNKVGTIVGSWEGASVGTSVTTSAGVVGVKDGNSVGIDDGGASSEQDETGYVR